MIAAVVVVISRLQQILGKHIRWNRHHYSNRLQADFTSSWAVFQVCHTTFIYCFAGDGFKYFTIILVMDEIRTQTKSEQN